MYQAFEDYVIAKRYEPKTASGILLSPGDETRYVIIKTNEHTKALEGKTVELESIHAARPLKDEQHYSINYKHIIAIYE